MDGDIRMKFRNGKKLGKDRGNKKDKVEVEVEVEVKAKKNK